MEQRTLDRSGKSISFFGLGGLVLDSLEQEEANRIVADAVDRGITYFDVAPRYGTGEERMGPALKPYRDKVFLACKTAERGRENASRELETSLWRLQTDHFDLYQLHALELHEVDEVFRPGGAMETFIEAKEAGKISRIGFSSHSVKAALAALDRYSFDTVLFPFNFVCWLNAGVGPQVIEKAKACGTDCLALKSIARGPWPKDVEKKWAKEWYQPFDDKEWIDLGVRFTLSQDITALVGPGEPELFEMAFDSAQNYKPLSDEELARLEEFAKKQQPLLTVY